MIFPPTYFLSNFSQLYILCIFFHFKKLFLHTCKHLLCGVVWRLWLSWSTYTTHTYIYDTAPFVCTLSPLQSQIMSFWALLSALIGLTFPGSVQSTHNQYRVTLLHIFLLFNMHIPIEKFLLFSFYLRNKYSVY